MAVSAPPDFAAARRASAGGLHALEILLCALPQPFPIAIAVVLHLSPDHDSVLAEVLTRTTGRRVEWATDGALLRPGAVYAAPRDRHLEVDLHGMLTLLSTPRVHFSRPSVDRLFASAAKAFGERVLAVILTGNGSDGAAGALAVHNAGGVVLAQDKESSEFFNMPREAISAGGVTTVLPLRAIAPAITRLVMDGRPAIADHGGAPNAKGLRVSPADRPEPASEPRAPGS